MCVNLWLSIFANEPTQQQSAQGDIRGRGQARMLRPVWSDPRAPARDHGMQAMACRASFRRARDNISKWNWTRSRQLL